jgi:hypothetical protein
MSLNIPDVSDQGVTDLVKQIEEKGFGVIPNYVGAEELEQMRAFVAATVTKSGHQYVGLTGRDAVAGSRLDDFADSPQFQDLFRRVYEGGTGRHAPKVEFYQVLRCLTGQGVTTHSLNFHYDSYVVTALIPVEIPSEGQSGDLIMLPNTRSIRRSYATNLFDKVLLDNKLTQTTLRKLTKMKMLPLTRIKMVPGNLYFFWGYRSIHTNEACDPDKVRATALFHYVNPHADSKLGKKLRKEAN